MIGVSQTRVVSGKRGGCHSCCVGGVLPWRHTLQRLEPSGCTSPFLQLRIWIHMAKVSISVGSSTVKLIFWVATQP